MYIYKNAPIQHTQVVYMLMTPYFTDVNITTPSEYMHRFWAAVTRQRSPNTCNINSTATYPPASNVQYPQNVPASTTIASGNVPPSRVAATGVKQVLKLTCKTLQCV